MKTLALRTFAIAALSLALGPARADAALIINLDEVGSDVVMTGSGSLNVSGLTFALSGPYGPGISPDQFFILGAAGTMDVYDTPLIGPTNFGAGSYLAASSGTGDLFGLDFASGAVGVPADYVSGAALSGTATFSDASLVSLGVTPGVFTWFLGDSDMVTLTVNAGAPEPATYLLLAAGLLFVGLKRRRSA